MDVLVGGTLCSSAVFHGNSIKLGLGGLSCGLSLWMWKALPRMSKSVIPQASGYPAVELIIFTLPVCPMAKHSLKST